MRSFWRRFLPDREPITSVDFEQAAKIMHAHPVGWVEAVDISNALLFLASDESRFVTDTTPAVDAGASLK